MGLKESIEEARILLDQLAYGMGQSVVPRQPREIIDMICFIGQMSEPLWLQDPRYEDMAKKLSATEPFPYDIDTRELISIHLQLKPFLKAYLVKGFIS